MIWGDVELVNTLQYDPSKDNTDNRQTFPQLQEDEQIPMPQVADNYLDAKIMF